jgi:DNA uptake protein ComE-like DNA-binding protein
VRTKLVSSVVQNTIDTDIEHYSLSGAEKVPININTASKAKLKDLHGVTDDVADLIISKRSYKNRADALGKLGAPLWHSMVSTAGYSVRVRS